MPPLYSCFNLTVFEEPYHWVYSPVLFPWRCLASSTVSLCRATCNKKLLILTWFGMENPYTSVMTEGKSPPQVGIVMGSTSDYATLQHASKILTDLNLPFEERVVSAHRTPERLYEYARSARERGLKVIIAAAGGAAHLPGMTASMTTLPVLGVPIDSGTSGVGGLDSLLSIVQMPRGVPVGTLAIGNSGAINAALLACAIVALGNPDLSKRLDDWRARQTEAVPETPSPSTKP